MTVVVTNGLWIRSQLTADPGRYAWAIYIISYLKTYFISLLRKDKIVKRSSLK